MWEQKKNAPKLPSMVQVPPYVFSVTESGLVWGALAATGEVLFRERLGGTFSASPVVVGGKIYATNDEGETTVLSGGGKFEVLGKYALGERVQASVAVAHGRFYFRGERALICVGE